MNYTKEEFSFARFLRGVAPDPDLRVCATGAISWDEKSKIPHIDADRCINCGCCARRCPTRAIFYCDGHFDVQLNNSVAPYKLFRDNQVGPGYVLAELSFANTSYSGRIVAESDKLITNIYDKITSFMKEDPRIPNLLTRNLLLALDINAVNSRRGNVYSRTDIVFTMSGKLIVCEVEFNDTMIDTPRDIIEDIAIFISRYNYRINEIVPLVIGLQYPNKRSEFWEVLSDIKKVLGIDTHSLSIGALMLLVWNQTSFLNMSIDSIPTIGNERAGIRKAISKIIGRHPCLGEGVTYNVFEPQK